MPPAPRSTRSQGEVARRWREELQPRWAGPETMVVRVIAPAELGTSEGVQNGFAGPRFLCSGPALTAPGGHPMNHWKGGPRYLTDAAIETDDPADARAHAERLLNADSVGIKAIFDDGDPAIGSLPRLDRRVLEALVEVAHNRNTWVAVHAQADAEVRIAAELGVDSIEHGFVWDSPSAATLTVLAESDSVLVPTLSAVEHFAEALQSEALTALQRELPQRVKAAYDAGIPIGVRASPFSFSLEAASRWTWTERRSASDDRNPQRCRARVSGCRRLGRMGSFCPRGLLRPTLGIETGRESTCEVVFIRVQTQS